MIETLSAARQVVDDQALTRLQLAPEDGVAAGSGRRTLLGAVRGGGQGAKRHAFLGVTVTAYGVEPIYQVSDGTHCGADAAYDIRFAYNKGATVPVHVKAVSHPARQVVVWGADTPGRPHRSGDA
jgi:hypothetical protein